MPASLLLLLCLGAHAADGPVTWARHAVDREVSVELPGTVERRHEDRGVVVGHVVSDTVVSTWDEGWAAATVTTLPSMAVRLAGRHGVERRARAAVLEDHAADQVEERPVVRGDHEGVALTFTSHKGEAPRSGRSEIYTWDDRVVTLTAVQEPGSGPDRLPRFFASLRLEGPPATPPGPSSR